MLAFGRSPSADDVTRGLDLTGRTAIVTGVNSGLGFETARILASKGARVLGAARSLEKAEAAAREVGGEVQPVACELSDINSVRAAVETVDEPIDIIVANAGIMALQELETVEGVERQMFVNHVGHFALVTGLLGQLRDVGRVVMVASAAHSYARGDVAFDDLRWRGEYKPWVAYGRSKLANILFAKELARRLPTGQVANAVHPGVVDTELWRNMPPDDADALKNQFGLRTTAQGAATQVFVAAHPSVADVTGEYFSNCKIATPTALALDESLAAQLWETTERLISGL